METIQLRLSAPYLAVARNRDPFVLLEGPRGTLKTVSALDILMTRAYQFPGLRWYIWRSTRALLSTTVLPSFENYVIPKWASVEGMRLTNPGARPTHRTEYIFENGSVFTPVGIEDVLRGTSAEGAGGYLAEAVELGSVDQATALVGLMRQPGVPFHQIIGDVNPGAPNHWANQTAEAVPDSLRGIELDPSDLPQDRRLISVWKAVQAHNRRPATNPARRWKRILTSIVDNPFFFDIRTWSLTPAGRAYLKQLQLLSGHMFKRWVRGLWVAAEGSVYGDAFDEKRNVIAPFKIPRHWPVYVYADPGEDHPWAVGWFTISITGKKILIGEIHARKLGGVANVAKLIQEKNQALGVDPLRYYLDPRHGFSSTAQSPKTIAQQFADAGVPGFMPALRFQGKGYYASVEKVRTEFKAGNLLFFSDCTGFISDHQAWSYARQADGSVPDGDDAYEKTNDDGCLIGSTPIVTLAGTFPIRQLAGKSGYVWTPYGWRWFFGFKTHDCRKVWRLTLSNGATITATSSHRLLLRRGWDTVRLLRTGDVFYGPEDHHRQDSGISGGAISVRRGKAGEMGRREILHMVQPGQNKRQVSFEGPASGRMGARQWPDPFWAQMARSPQEWQPPRQSTLQSGTFGSIETLERAHDAGEANGFGEAASISIDSAGRRQVAQVARGPRVAFSHGRADVGEPRIEGRDVLLLLQNIPDSRRQPTESEEQVLQSEMSERVSLLAKEFAGETEVFDLCVPSLGYYCLNGIVTHNCDVTRWFVNDRHGRDDGAKPSPEEAELQYYLGQLAAANQGVTISRD